MKWKLLISLLVFFDVCASFDSILFSNDFIRSKDLETLLNNDLPPSDIFVFLVNDFSLPKFYQYINAYGSEGINPTSPLGKLLKAEYSESRSVNAPIELPGEGVTKFTDISSFQELESILQEVKLPSKFTALVTSPSVLVKYLSKRLSSDATVFGRQANVEEGNDDSQLSDEDPEKETFKMPVVIPPADVVEGPCLLYLEGVRIVLKNKADTFHEVVVPSANNTYTWKSSDVFCELNQGVGIVNFAVQVNLGVNAISEHGSFQIDAGQSLLLELVFNATVRHYWNLQEIRTKGKFIINSLDKKFIDSDLEVSDLSITDVQHLGIGSVYNYAVGCWLSPAAFMKVKDDTFIGIGFQNIHVTLNAYNSTNATSFDYLVSDCVGSFSVGSWMGIISSFVLLTVLLFGYLMLQSVQTPDRYDDARQKGYTINFRE